MKKTIPPELKEMLRQRIIERLANKEEPITQNALADELVINRAYMSHIVNGTYDSMNEKGTALGANDWLKIARRFELLAQVVETRQYLSIMDALGDALEHGTNAILDMITGTGKSMTARIFAAQHSGSVFVVSLKSDYTNSDLALATAEAIGVKVSSTRCSQIRAEIVKYCKRMNKRFVLVIDEGESGKSHTWGFFKNLWDAFEENNMNFAFVLLGGQTMQSGAFGEKLAKSVHGKSLYLAQLYRRLGGNYTMIAPPTLEERMAFVAHKGIFEAPIQRLIANACKEYATCSNLVAKLKAQQREAGLTAEQMTTDLATQYLKLDRAA